MSNLSAVRRSIRRTVAEDGVIYSALGILARRLKAPGALLTDINAAADFFRLQLVAREHEVFACAFLDNKLRVLAYEELFRGTIDGATVHPREVVKACLRHNAAAVMFAHNHPSGDPTPSRLDREITEQLTYVLGLVDVRVIDHFVIGRDGFRSAAEAELRAAPADELHKNLRTGRAKKNLRQSGSSRGAT